MATDAGSDKIVCPKCGFQQYKRSAICKKCGLIFDKWREMQAKKQKAERAEMAAAPEVDEETQRTVSPVLVVLAIAAIAASFYILVVRKPGAEPAPSPTSTAQGPAAPAAPGKPAAAAPAAGPGITRLTPGAAAATPGAPTQQRPAPAAARDPQADRYDAYKADLAQAVQTLAAFEKKLKEGVDFKTMRSEFLDTRTAVARAFKEPPNEGWISYQAVDKALTAYSDSLKFWEYRVYSADYRNRLWCAGEACPFQTEQEFKEAVGKSVNLCWDRASAFREMAQRYLEYGDALSLETDAASRQQLAESYKPVDEIWKKLGRPSG